MDKVLGGHSTAARHKVHVSASRSPYKDSL